MYRVDFIGEWDNFFSKLLKCDGCQTNYKSV